MADWQYLGVGKFMLGLEWNCGRKARKGHICEDTFAYGSYSSKDIPSPNKAKHKHACMPTVYMCIELLHFL